MRVSTIASTLALAASGVQAQYYANQSAPFYLVLSSQNETLNGTTLSSYHEGAAIESFGLGGPLSTASVEYTFNYSIQSWQDPPPTGVNLTGLLTWELRGGNFNLSSPMQLSYTPSSNVAVPLLEPSDDGTLVAFDDENKLTILSYQDDTKPLPNYAVTPTYNWYVCTTYVGYLYQTLAWVVGNAEPQNPTCQKVDVLRIFK
ncbi:hypothetical protein LSUE1_G000088 [Lachnellula suecica]|uniref:DUF7907 domain-containing protein n=1 Tax=Lachnellula suecica TaxID=602035 RepID=A0A8T9CIY6_9HELO|nr:hypothetical protein LSUE1_G000088 [Lachnellula suecica]